MGESEQFTGLQDKNDVDIYEGDIVKIHNLVNEFKCGEPSRDWRVFKVEYNRYLWAFNSNSIYMPMDERCSRTSVEYDIEIIGNIHENEDLLT